MKKTKDFKLPYKVKPRWSSNNPETLSVKYTDFLEGEWNNATHAVIENGKGVILLSDLTIVGIMVPEGIFQEFYSKMPNSKDVDPIGYISEAYFKSNFERCKSRLMSGKNLMVLNESETPLFGVACREFSSVLETDENGIVKFREGLFNNLGDNRDDFLDTFSL